MLKVKTVLIARVSAVCQLDVHQGATSPPTKAPAVTHCVIAGQYPTHRRCGINTDIDRSLPRLARREELLPIIPGRLSAMCSSTQLVNREAGYFHAGRTQSSAVWISSAHLPDVTFVKTNDRRNLTGSSGIVLEIISL